MPGVREMGVNFLIHGNSNNPIREVFLKSLWYGMGLIISKGLQKYQESKRKESEDKVILALLKNSELIGHRRIWQETKIYKNNVKPILTKLSNEGKIIKFEKIKISKYYPDKNGYVSERITERTIYLPNLKNRYVFNLVKKELPKLFYATKRKWIRKGVRDFLKICEEKYQNLTIEEAYARDKGVLASSHRLSDYGSELIYGTHVGSALLVILDILKLLPEKGYTIKELDKKFKIVSNS